jgi:hypothetical protein
VLVHFLESFCSDPIAWAGVPCRAQLFTWGWNQRGTLGHPPKTKTESSPGPVHALAGLKIVQVRLSSALPCEVHVRVLLTEEALPMVSLVHSGGDWWVALPCS